MVLVLNPDPLVSLEPLKISLGIDPSDSSEDDLLSMLIPEVSALITTHCNRTHFLVSNPAAIITDYYSGNNGPDLVLRQWPVQTPTFTGNLTANSAVVTNLQAVSLPILTDRLFVGQPVIGPVTQAGVQAIPTGAVIASIDNSSQVTLSQPAAATVTAAPILFDIAVWTNATGYWGASPGSYSSTAQLQSGADYGLQRDLPGGAGSKSGIIRRLNGWWDGRFATDYGRLSSYSVRGTGNIQVQALFGFATAPPAVESACKRAIAKMRVSARTGQQLQQEHLGNYSYSLIGDPKNVARLGVLGADVAAMLAPFRILSVGGY